MLYEWNLFFTLLWYIGLKYISKPNNRSSNYVNDFFFLGSNFVSCDWMKLKRRGLSSLSHMMKQYSRGARTVWIRRVLCTTWNGNSVQWSTLCCGCSFFFNSLWCWEKGANEVAVSIHIINTSWYTCYIC